MAKIIQLQMRRDTAALWTSTNPTPADGEWCLETDTRRIKIGDGVTAWTSLLYRVEVDSVFGRTGAVVALQADYDGFFLTPAEGNAAYGSIGDVSANTAKVTNATHTGQVTGAAALALDITAITAQPAAGALIGADTFIINDGGVLSEITATQISTFMDTLFLTPAEGDAAYGTIAAVALNTAKISYTDAAAVALNTAKVTNAVHTGDVTGGTALTIAAKAVDIAMLADGIDGELITWDAVGVAATVPVGTATHVLTSNGVGVAPTFQAPAGGAGNVTKVGTPVNNQLGVWTGDGTIEGDTGLTFSGTTLNTAGINLGDTTLGDYEEGTFQPELKFNNAQALMTFLIRDGHYQRVGNLCTVWFRIELSNLGSSTGQAEIDNLPFLNVANNTLFACTIGQYSGMSLVANRLGGLARSGQDKYDLNDSNTLATTQVNETNFNSDSKIFGSGTYEIA